MSNIVLIIGAMDEEVQALKNRMQECKQIMTDSIEVCEGLLGGQKVVVAKSGIGKVNAAYTTTSLIKYYSPETVINIGSAGGTLANQSVGDIVVANKLQYHDFDIGPNTITDPRFIFVNNNSNIASISEIIKSQGLTVHVGLIVSGDQFVTKDSEAFKRIQSMFKEAIAVDMEATAIAAVCEKTMTPWIVLRALSDVTHNEGNDIDFETYLKTASENSALITEKYLSE